jgi:hypothetical protein
MERSSHYQAGFPLLSRSRSSQCNVNCTSATAAGGGVLEVIARDAVLSLDTGRIVSLQEIEAVLKRTGPSGL